MSDYAKWTVATLRAELSRRGFSRPSKKNEMIKLLQDDDEKKERELLGESVNDDDNDEGACDVKNDEEILQEESKNDVDMETGTTDTGAVEDTQNGADSDDMETGATDIGAVEETQNGADSDAVKQETETLGIEQENADVKLENNEENIETHVIKSEHQTSASTNSEMQQVSSDTGIVQGEPGISLDVVKEEATDVVTEVDNALTEEKQEANASAIDSSDSVEENTKTESTVLENVTNGEAEGGSKDDDTQAIKDMVERALSDTFAEKEEPMDCATAAKERVTDEAKTGNGDQDENQDHSNTQERTVEEIADENYVHIDTVGEVDDEFAISMAMLDDAEKESETAESKGEDKQEDEEEEEEDDEERFLNPSRLDAWIRAGYNRGKRKCSLYICNIKKYKLLGEILVDAGKKAVQFMYKLDQFGKGYAALDFGSAELCESTKQKLKEAFGENVKLHLETEVPDSAKWFVKLARGGEALDFRVGHNLIIQDYPEDASLQKLTEMFPNAIFMARVNDPEADDEKIWFQKKYRNQLQKFQPPENYKSFVLVEFCSSHEANKAAEAHKEAKIDDNTFTVQTLEAYQAWYIKEFEQKTYRVALERIYKDEDRIEMLTVLSQKRKELIDVKTKLRRRSDPKGEAKHKVLLREVYNLTGAIKIDTQSRVQVNVPVPEGRKLMTRHTFQLWNSRIIESKQDGKKPEKAKNDSAKAPGASKSPSTAGEKKPEEEKDEPNASGSRDPSSSRSKGDKDKREDRSMSKQRNRSPARAQNQSARPKEQKAATVPRQQQKPNRIRPRNRGRNTQRRREAGASNRSGDLSSIAPVLALEEEISKRQQQIVMQQEMLERYEQLVENQKRAALMTEFAAANAVASEHYQRNLQDQSRSGHRGSRRDRNRRNNRQYDDRRTRDDKRQHYGDTSQYHDDKSLSPSSHRSYDRTKSSSREAYDRRDSRDRNSERNKRTSRHDEEARKRGYSSQDTYSHEPEAKRVKPDGKKHPGETAASVATVLKGLTQVINSKMDEIARKAMVPAPQKSYATQSTDLSRPKAALPRAALPARQNLMSQSDRYGDSGTSGGDMGQYESRYGYQ